MTRVTKSVRMIFWIGLIAGTLDITENIVFNAFRGITPWRIFQFIASGLIDGRSFQLGWALVVLGVVIHFIVLPLSAVPPRPGASTLVVWANAVFALMFCIGLPVALLVKRAREVQAT